MDDLEKDDDEEERRIMINPEYGLVDSRDVWSYTFQADSFDDFQLALKNPNPSHYEGRKAWSEKPDLLFVRVTVAPSPEHDATLYVTFTKPCKQSTILT